MCTFQVAYNLAVEQAKKFVDYETKKKCRLKPNAFEVGDKVMRRKQGRRGNQLLPADWMGPYQVAEVHQKGQVTLIREGQAMKRKVKTRQLMPWKREPSRYG